MEVICQILSLPCVIYFVYYIVTSLFFLKNERKCVKKHKFQKKFAIVIAARNEASVIANLINSLKKQRYPKELYTIFVAPNNCTDNTAIVAENAGATNIDVNIKTKTKGQVLNYVFDKLVYRGQYGNFDGYIIFDADNIVHPNFLSRMNDALCEGHEVVQGFRDSKNPGDSWVSASHSLFCWGQNVFFNSSRQNMNLSAIISGTGFMVSHKVLFDVGFNPQTMSEDTEFTVKCLLHGVKVTYIDNAIFYDEQCTTLKVSMKQRTRWSTGTYQCLNKYWLELFKYFVNNKKWIALDMIIFLLGPLMQALGVLNIGLLALCNFLNLKVYTMMGILLCIDIFGIIISYCVAVLIEMFLVMVCKKNIKNVLSGILLFPVFMFTWLPINIICIFKKYTVWEPIAHQKNVEIETMLNLSKEEKVV